MARRCENYKFTQVGMYNNLGNKYRKMHNI